MSEFEWFKKITDIDSATGIDSRACDGYKQTCRIEQRARDNEPIRAYSLHQAWPVKVEYGEWDAESTDKVMVTMELAYDYPDIKNL